MEYVGALAASTVIFGALNNVASKIRSVSFGPFNYLTVLLNSVLYLGVYSLTLFCKRKLGLIHDDEIEMFWGKRNRPRTSDGHLSPQEESLLLDGKRTSRDVVNSATSIYDSPWFFALIAGTMDASGNLMGFVAQAHLPQILYQLFLQNLVMFSVVLSMIILGRRYSVYHVVGLTMTIVSGLVGLIPNLGQPQSSIDFHWGLLAAFSTLPTALSYVAKERLFKVYEERANKDGNVFDETKTLDVFVLNTHVAIVQVFVTPLLAPFNKLIGETGTVPLTQYAKDGIMCLAGTEPHHVYAESTQCQYAAYSYLAYIVFNLCFNVSLVALTKYGTSVQSWMVVRLLLPTTLVLLLYKGWPLLKPGDSGINIYIITGAALAFAGASVFRFSTVYIDHIKEKYNITGEITCMWPLKI